MRIGELARATGVDVETIRYYEKAGLLPEPPRHANGYRDYGERHAERLAFVRHCRALDMPLADVKRLLDYEAHPEADCGDVNRLIDEQLARVRERLSSMRTLEQQLESLRGRCVANRTAGECGILNELVAAFRHPPRAPQPASATGGDRDGIEPPRRAGSSGHDSGSR